ncbi:hypothetical protein PYW08_013767 [Mythimna loreyi]|uniref:Uncharacterized protein n=1 Tax=Mythimna loreyi TaxID=667449 RepID=A0ACC2R5P1_9NEOP|nr:hypothetical protein PYW08_013767 [Mythimna loreyi]
MCENVNENSWRSRRANIIATLSQTLGVNTMLYLPTLGVLRGALGHVLAFAVVYIVLGIPLLYMESVVGQFTGRDCLDVWRARACLSHVGYSQIIWQLLFFIHVHTINSFLVHYFLISFENPIPYFVCGNWSTNDCDIINFNYTVNQDCLKMADPLPYCKDLCSTFPEYQYWRFKILGQDKTDTFHLPWRVGLASLLISFTIFISCFRRAKSLKWALWLVTLYPMSARFFFLIGSMLQKGVVVKYKEALDSDFSIFIERFDLANVIAEVLYSLNVGTGLAFGTASRYPFRAPSYSNTVIVVVVTACVAILGTCSTVMMTCPYAFKYDIEPALLMKYPISNSFEKIPRLLHVYEQTSLWLIINFSFTAVSSISSSICVMSGCIEMLSKRYPKVDRNPHLVSFIFVLVLYLGSFPLLRNRTLYYLEQIKSAISLLVIFLVLMEIIVFVLWYGLDRFSEDLHFMQGVQPNISVKASWLLSSVILVYVFITECYGLYSIKDRSFGFGVGWYTLLCSIIFMALVSIVRVLLALYNNKLYEEIGLDPEWGPMSELLRRSRAMFTAQAMTKEYMYRQYHLQAGILKRQKQSNVRTFYQPVFVPKTEGVRFEDEETSAD